MDIYCHRCGEPWDVETFHDVADELGITFTEATRRFQADGCTATGWCGPCESRDTARTAAAAALVEVLGDDVDGIAAMMEDFEYMMGGLD